uniref:DUF4220 domain-containing protein n=1 Tax=Arundo donax TaxID=35708 RepID=A0A0A9DFG5_ARUDO
MAFYEDWDCLQRLSLLIRRLWRFLLLMVFGTVAGLLVLLVAVIGRSILSTIVVLFMRDKVTRMASVELWVVLTTLMLVVRFLLDFFGPWYAYRSMTGLVLTIEMLNYSLVHYTMGLMQLSASKVNDYFQVWAVLLVTLQYSVKIGRPYTRSKQIPLLDLMSSFWAANLIRMQTFFHLRIPLWSIWALNAARIISYFFSSDKAEAINQESTRIVADYMSYEHELGSGSQLSVDGPNIHDKEFTMKWYKYLVLGEDQVLKDLQEGRLVPAAQKEYVKGRRRVLRLDPNEHKKLITVDKIWDVDAVGGGLQGLGGTADGANRLKDVCLSFSLYKLLRRRFYDLPLHESRLLRQGKKIRRLVFKYILYDAERAFRVMAIEVSFLQDLFYSKHAAMFAAGFPTMSLVLSLLLVTATGYIAYPVRYIPKRMDQADSNKITHGVFITRVIIALIIGKELAEIYIYVFSQWTKVLMLCSYTKHQWSRHPLVEMAMRALLGLMTRGSWNEKIRQHNLLISSRGLKIQKFTMHRGSKFPKGIKMEACTKDAIFKSFKRLEKNPKSLDSYFSNAFGPEDQCLHRKLLWADELEADTHRILVWHIATCLCEINLASDKATVLQPIFLSPRPFVNKPKSSTPNDSTSVEAGVWWEHYTTAASLSNYCAYLVTQALVPDNGLVANKVFFEVRREINHVTLDGRIEYLLRPRSMRDVFTRLMRTVDMADEEEAEDEQASDQENTDEEASVVSEADLNKKQRRGGSLDLKNSLTRKGAILGKQLMEAFAEDRAGLWEKLAVFWTGFLLHLAASTRASKHKTRLAGSRELTTHLWTLLSHAGFLGRDPHGQALLDPEDLLDVDPVS